MSPFTVHLIMIMSATWPPALHLTIWWCLPCYQRHQHHHHHHLHLVRPATLEWEWRASARECRKCPDKLFFKWSWCTKAAPVVGTTVLQPDHSTLLTADHRRPWSINSTWLLFAVGGIIFAMQTSTADAILHWLPALGAHFTRSFQ